MGNTDRHYSFLKLKNAVIVHRKGATDAKESSAGSGFAVSSAERLQPNVIKLSNF